MSVSSARSARYGYVPLRPAQGQQGDSAADGRARRRRSAIPPPTAALAAPPRPPVALDSPQSPGAAGAASRTKAQQKKEKGDPFELPRENDRGASRRARRAAAAAALAAGASGGGGGGPSKAQLKKEKAVAVIRVDPTIKARSPAVVLSPESARNLPAVSYLPQMCARFASSI